MKMLGGDAAPDTFLRQAALGPEPEVWRYLQILTKFSSNQLSPSSAARTGFVFTPLCEKYKVSSVTNAEQSQRGLGGRNGTWIYFHSLFEPRMDAGHRKSKGTLMNIKQLKTSFLFDKKE